MEKLYSWEEFSKYIAYSGLSDYEKYKSNAKINSIDFDENGCIISCEIKARKYYNTAIKNMKIVEDKVRILDETIKKCEEIKKMIGTTWGGILTKEDEDFMKYLERRNENR